MTLSAPPTVGGESAPDRGERAGAIAGILCAPVLLAGFFFAAPVIRDTTADAEIVSLFLEYRDGIVVNLLLQLVAVPLYFLFAAGPRTRLRRAAGEGGILADVAFGSAVAGLGLTALYLGFQGALVEMAPRAEVPLLAGLARLVDGVDTVSALFVGLTMVAASLAVVRSGALPRGLGWCGLLGGLLYGGSAANIADIDGLGLVGFLGFLGFLVWTLGAAVAQLRGGRAGAPVAAASAVRRPATSRQPETAEG